MNSLTTKFRLLLIVTITLVALPVFTTAWLPVQISTKTSTTAAGTAAAARPLSQQATATSATLLQIASHHHRSQEEDKDKDNHHSSQYQNQNQKSPPENISSSSSNNKEELAEDSVLQPQQSMDDSNNGNNNQHQQPQQQPQQRNVTQEALKKVRVAKAQAEIDRILTGPDAPIDTEAELEKTISMSRTGDSDQPPHLDTEYQTLEQELYQAVKQQDFSLAQTKKDGLAKVQDTLEEGSAVLAVNAAFYRAFSQKSAEDMEHVWVPHDDSSVCIHPSHKPVVGARRILKSWQQMFASANNSFQRNWMEPHNLRVVQKGSHVAVVTCEEHVFARRFIRGQKRQTELINKLLATNIFRKIGNRWYLWYHHASWHPESEAAKRALKAKSSTAAGGGQVIPETTSSTNSLAANLAAKRRKKRRQQEDEEDEDFEDKIGMDGILGSSDYGPLLGDGDADDNDGKPAKRVIVGSLNDLLGGGLDGLLGGNSQSGQASNSNNPMNSNIPQDGAIVQFSRIEDDDDDDDDEDEESLFLSDEDDDDEEDDEENEAESDAMIKEWAKSTSSSKKGNDQSSGNSSKSGSTTSSKKESNGSNNKAFKDTLRQSCISALRKLAEQGSISPRQKRVLLTDIISCSSKGEYSMVEIAYELLCGEGGSEDDDTAEEEFADQCRVFAESQLEPESTPPPPF